MTHEPEVAAAGYLARTMSPRERLDFEAHLLDCEVCWYEVDAGRRGREVAEAARELAPQHLRESVRALVTSSAASAPPARPARWGIALAAASLLVVFGAGAWRVATGRPQSQPVAIAAAVAGFQAQRLPGQGIPGLAPPDLAALRLLPVGSSAGQLESIDVTAYAYRDGLGRRLLIYVSERPFPTASGAHAIAGTDGAWIATTNGVSVLCARSPQGSRTAHALLILGHDETLVHDAARSLGAISA